MKPVLISSGEPSGIGPDICLSLVNKNLPVVIAGDVKVLQARAKHLKKAIIFERYQENKPINQSTNCLTFLPIDCPNEVIPGQLNPLNANYVLDMLRVSSQRCLSQEFSALVTAPIHKGVINQAGINFTGHTEFLADFFKADSVVMMLMTKTLKIALTTTHLALKQVPRAITQTLLINVMNQIHKSLRRDFGLVDPKIYVAGLNPHAGEDGYLGKEELTVIIPAIQALTAKGLNIIGPLAADTLFNPRYLKDADVFLTMYHDQGLPVLKYAGFGHAVNVTLGLPIVRTSVDHGTALALAGSGKAQASSLEQAAKVALEIVYHREKNDY